MLIMQMKIPVSGFIWYKTKGWNNQCESGCYAKEGSQGQVGLVPMGAATCGRSIWASLCSRVTAGQPHPGRSCCPSKGTGGCTAQSSRESEWDLKMR